MAVKKTGILGAIITAAVLMGQYRIGDGKDIGQIGKKILNESSVNEETTDLIQNSSIAIEGHNNDSYTVLVDYKESNECSSDVWNIKSNRNRNINSSLPEIRIKERLQEILLRECLNVVQLAAECCRLDEIIDLVSSGENIDDRYENGWTLYHLAIIMFDNSFQPTVREDRHKCPPRAKLRTNCSYELLQNLVSVDADGNVADVSGRTALHLAVMAHHEHAVQLLVKNGVFLDATDIHQRTALHLAVLADNLPSVRLLMENGASSTIRDEEGNTPLHLAVSAKNTEISEGILSIDDVSIDMQNMKGLTPLHIAASSGNKLIFNNLIRHHANPELLDDRHETILHKAVKGSHVRICELIFQKTNLDVNIRNDLGQTVLHLATLMKINENNDDMLPIINIVFENGADPEIEDKQLDSSFVLASKDPDLFEIYLNASSKKFDHCLITGEPLIHKVMRNNCFKCFEALLKRGANPNSTNIFDGTILHLAVTLDSPEWIETVMNTTNIDINVKGGYGLTPLLLATRDSKDRAATFLLSKGADPYVADDFGCNSLHYASNHISAYFIVERILNISISDIDHRDAFGATALVHAMNTRMFKNVEVLLERGANPLLWSASNETLLHLASLSSAPELMLTIINRTTIDMNPKNIYGETALHYAIGAYNDRVADFLLSKGSDPYISVPKNRMTALHLAAYLKSSYFIFEKILNSSTSGIDMKDIHGDTALIYAAHLGVAKNVNELLKRGADPQFLQVFNETIFKLAILRGHIDMLGLLVNKTFIDVNALILHDMTLPTEALEAGQSKAVDFLISINASFCARDPEGQTLLHKIVFYSEDIGTNIINTVVDKCEGILDVEDEEGNTALATALMFGNIEVFRMIRDQGASTTLPHGRAFLHLAASSHSLDLVELILEEGGSNLNLQDAYGRALVDLAASYSIDLVDLLSSEGRGSDVNLKDDYGNTPLMYAVDFQDFRVIELLLSKNADPFIENNIDMSPIKTVAANGDARLGRLFSRYPSDPEQLLGVAIRSFNFETMRYYLLCTMRSRKNLKLHLLAFLGKNIELSKVLPFRLEQYKRKLPNIMYEFMKDYLIFVEEVEQEDMLSGYNYGLTPLEMAILFSGKLDTVKILENYEENNSIRIPKSVWTPADIAVFSMNLTIIHYFFKGNLQLAERIDKYGWTAMHKAAWVWNFWTIEYFHMIGADIDKKDNYGKTPLHLAALRGYFYNVQRILQISNVSINEKDKYHFTPLHMAAIYAHPKFFEKLSKISITMPGRLRYRIKDFGFQSPVRNPIQVMMTLLEAKADPNVRDLAFGWTPLHWAAANGDLNMIKLLLKNGASVNLPSRNGQTPMYVARFWGRKYVYRYLSKNNGVW